MALILNIETSTEVCSVALARDGVVTYLRENLSGQNHAMFLTIFIKEILEESKISVDQLGAVAVSGGPGSYTGLRIGVSVAKGICYAAHLPLVTITSLEAMAHHVIENVYPLKTDNTLFCPMIDARRMEVYTSFYDKNCAQIRGVQADIIDHESYLEFLENNLVLFFGNGANKCMETISHPHAVFIDHIQTSARHMAWISEHNYVNKKFADLAYYEPLYLKDFVPTIPVKNIFKTRGNI